MAINYQGGNDSVITGAFAPLMQTLQRNYLFEQEQRNQQAKQAAELQKQIQKDLSQVNANGLRQADLPAFTQQYSGVKENYYKFLNAKSPEERSSYAMQINEGLSNLNTLVGTSKEYGKIYSNSLSGLGSLVGKGKVDEARKRLLELGSKPSSELTREAFDTSDLLHTYDSDKANTNISKGIESAFKNSANVTTETILGYITDLGGGRRERRAVDRSILNEGVPLDIVSKLYQTNTDVKGLVDDVMTEQSIDLNTALAQVASLHEGEFVKDTARNVNPDKSQTTFNIDARTMTPSEEVSTTPLRIGKFTSDSSITRNEKGVLLSGEKDFFDPDTGNKIPVGRDNFEVDYTQDVRLNVDKDGNPVEDDSAEAVGTQNFAVAQMVDPQQSGIVVQLGLGNYYRRTVLIPEGDRQLFGKSKTVKQDATRRSQQNTSNRNTQNNSVPSRSGLTGGNVR